MSGAVARPFVYHGVHPVTRARFKLSARTAGEREAYKHRVASMRNALRLGTMTSDDVVRELKGLRPSGAMTLQGAADAYCQRPQLARRTRERVATQMRVLPTLAPLRLTQLTRARITVALEARARGEGANRRGRARAPSTVEMDWMMLRAVVGYAIDRGWLDGYPWGMWKPRLAPKGDGRVREACRTIGELVQLIGAAWRIDPTGRVAACIGCAALLGLRQGELAGLRWSDVDRTRGTVTIARQWDGDPVKGRRGGTLRAPAALFDLLDRFKAITYPHGMRPEQEQWPVFHRLGKHRLRDALSTEKLQAAVRVAGLPNVRAWTAHSMRDTFCTLDLIARRGDLAGMMARSRHASITSALKYVRALEREAPAPFELPPLLAAAGGEGDR